MAYYPNAVYSVFSFLGFIVVIIPLRWHLEAWNVGTCLYIFWTATGCISGFVNSIVFKNTEKNVAPVWCYISSRIVVLTSVGIPTSVLCITRRLYYISMSKTVVATTKTKVIITDLAIGLGFPILEAGLHTIVEDPKYVIYEKIGCLSSPVPDTALGVVLILMWPTVFGVVSAIYSYLVIRAFVKQRARLKEFLSSNNNLNVNRYSRLIALASCDICFTVPFCVFFLYRNINWDYFRTWALKFLKHEGAVEVPFAIWYAFQLGPGLELSRWLPVFWALLFFVFFGFAEEAIKHYCLAYNWIAKCFGCGGSPTSSTTTSDDAPSPVDRPFSASTHLTRERSSFPIFSTDISESGNTDSEDFVGQEESHSTPEHPFSTAKLSLTLTSFPQH